MATKVNTQAIEEYLKLLPKEMREASREIFEQYDEEDYEEIFQNILNIMNEETFYSSESIDDEEEQFWESMRDPNVDEMEEYAKYLETTQLENELEQLVKDIEKNHQIYPNDVISISDARELAKQYNQLPVSETMEGETLTRKNRYVINNFTVLTISKYVHKSVLTLEKLVDFLDNYHNYNVIGSLD